MSANADLEADTVRLHATLADKQFEREIITQCTGHVHEQLVIAQAELQIASNAVREGAVRHAELLTAAQQLVEQNSQLRAQLSISPAPRAAGCDGGPALAQLLAQAQPAGPQGMQSEAEAVAELCKQLWEAQQQAELRRSLLQTTQQYADLLLAQKVSRGVHMALHRRPVEAHFMISLLTAVLQAELQVALAAAQHGSASSSGQQGPKDASCSPAVVNNTRGSASASKTGRTACAWDDSAVQQQVPAALPRQACSDSWQQGAGSRAGPADVQSQLPDQSPVHQPGNGCTPPALTGSQEAQLQGTPAGPQLVTELAHACEQTKSMGMVDGATSPISWQQCSTACQASAEQAEGACQTVLLHGCVAAVQTDDVPGQSWLEAASLAETGVQAGQQEFVHACTQTEAGPPSSTEAPHASSGGAAELARTAEPEADKAEAAAQTSRQHDAQAELQEDCALLQCKVQALQAVIAIQDEQLAEARQEPQDEVGQEGAQAGVTCMDPSQRCPTTHRGSSSSARRVLTPAAAG